MTPHDDGRGFRFVKMHGAGNDYIYVDVDADAEAFASYDDLPGLARRLSDRHTGVGADGLILVLPGEGDADVRMRMFNADGSEGSMCGNGVRCVAKFAVDNGLVPLDTPAVRVATRAGRRDVELVREHGNVVGARVDMGTPELGPPAVGLAHDALPGVPHTLTFVSVGNPHAVAFVDDLDALDLPREGPRVAAHPDVTGGINAHFVQVLAPVHVRVVHWERGSGPTLACGTGACAVVAAGVLRGLVGRDVRVDVPGGTLDILWDLATDRLRMTGPAVTVFEGYWPCR